MCEYEEPQDELMKQTVVSEEEKSHCFRLNLTDRGTIKQELLRMGWPVKDDVPMIDGEPLDAKKLLAGGILFSDSTREKRLRQSSATKDRELALVQSFFLVARAKQLSA